jgi:hypothetical protein
MIKVPCKITPLGDKKYARNFIGAAQSQMRILENQLAFRDLKQGVRKVRLDPKTTCEAIVCFDLSEVKIYSEPDIIKMRKEGGLDELYPRFFAYIIKTDDITGITTKDYYWLYFNKKGNSLDEFEQTNGRTPTELSEDYEVYVWKVPGNIRDLMILSCAEKPTENKKELLEKMRDVPFYSSSVFTKSFMTYAADDEEKEDGRRFAAAAHLMTSDYVNVFEPIHWPNCINNVNRFPIPTYPRPGYCSPADLRLVGLYLRCPPNRFYCNTEERMMVWYTAKSYNPEIYGQDFICGVILNLNTATVRTFTFYPSNGDGHGFEPYWTVEEMHEVPYSMMTEVEELTEEELTIKIQWERRPIRIKASLKTGIIEYEEVASVEHRVWTGVETGFNTIPFAEFSQIFEGPPSDHDIIVTQEEYDCSQHSGDVPNCDGHVRELRGTDYSVAPPSDLTKHSAYDIAFYGKTYGTEADKKYAHLGESVSTRIQQCAHTMGGSCFSQYINLVRTRNVSQDTEKKVAHGVYASWINPNTAFVLNERDRDYLNGSAQFCGLGYGGNTWGDWQNECPLDGYPEYPITYTCFYRFPAIPIEIWDRLGNEQFYDLGLQTCLERDGTDDTDNLTEINKYTIDEEIVLDGEEVDRTYYLDDRATDDNQGIIVAAKGMDVEDPPKPDYWNINWKMTWNEDDRSLHGCTTPDEDINYIDIKDKLFEALDCEVHELIDFGLV